MQNITMESMGMLEQELNTFDEILLKEKCRDMLQKVFESVLPAILAPPQEFHEV